MEIGLGQRYTATVENITVPSSPSSFDLFQMATSSTVPIIVDRIVVTAGVTSSAILRLSLLRRTSSGTGGAGITPNPTASASPAASTTVSNLLTGSTGTAGALIDTQQWNEFAPYEFNQKPGGILVPVSGYLSLFINAVPGSPFPCSFTIEFIELK